MGGIQVIAYLRALGFSLAFVNFLNNSSTSPQGGICPGMALPSLLSLTVFKFCRVLCRGCDRRQGPPPRGFQLTSQQRAPAEGGREGGKQAGKGLGLVLMLVLVLSSHPACRGPSPETGGGLLLAVGRSAGIWDRLSLLPKQTRFQVATPTAPRTCPTVQLHTMEENNGGLHSECKLAQSQTWLGQQDVWLVDPNGQRRKIPPSRLSGNAKWIF